MRAAHTDPTANSYAHANPNANSGANPDPDAGPNAHAADAPQRKPRFR